MYVAENSQELKFWVDKDVKPYIEGENPFYDEVLNEIANSIIEQVRKNKLNAQDDTDTSEH